MKWVSLFLVLLLGLAAILVNPVPAPEPQAAPGSAEPPVAVCPTEEGGGRSTSLAVTSTVVGEGLVTVFSGGTSAGVGRYETDSSGAVTVNMGSISAVGEAAALVEFPAANSAAATISVGSTSISAEACARTPDRQAVVGGATTLEGTSLHLQLMNPYATEAQIDISAFSESGRESADALEGLIVPARSSVTLDLANILPGRESLSLALDTTRGSVIASMRSDIDGDSAVWRPVAASGSWILPVAAYGEGTRELIIVSTNSADVSYQIDVFGDDGLEEAVLDGTVEGRGEQAIDLGALGDGALAVRVVAEAPIAVFGRFSTAGATALTSGSPAAASDWLLPGAGSVVDGRSTVAIVNVGVDVAEVTFTRLRDESTSSVISIEPGTVFASALGGPASDGVTLESNGEIVPMLLVQRGQQLSLSGGVPLTNE